LPAVLFPGLAATLRRTVAPTWDAAVSHRFVDELWSGAVSEEVMARYLVQDHQFLDAFLALLGATMACADRAGVRLVYARQLGLLVSDENNFFARSFDALDVSSADRSSPVLLAPTRGFLELMGEARASADYPSCLAVLLVAEWLYQDWATRGGARAPDEPRAREWIDLHRGPDFARWVDLLRDEFDRVGADLDPAHRHRVAALFHRAVDLELAFFDAAYAGSA